MQGPGSTKVQLRSNFCRASHISLPQLMKTLRKGSLLGPHQLPIVKDLKDRGNRGVSPHSLQQMLGAPALVLCYFREKLHWDKTGNLYMPCPKKASDLPDPFCSVLNQRDALHSLSCSPTLKRGPWKKPLPLPWHLTRPIPPLQLEMAGAPFCIDSRVGKLSHKAYNVINKWSYET